MLSHQQRIDVCVDIGIAVTSGARVWRACQVVGINKRTLKRWQFDVNQPQQVQQITADQRPLCTRAKPKHALSLDERALILEVCNQKQYSCLPPSQIVPKLADIGVYIASESSFYRVLRQAKQLSHRGKSKVAQTQHKPTSYTATGPNQVWMWDITYFPSGVRGIFFYLYSIEDLYSRKIVAWEIYATESAQHAKELMQKAKFRGNFKRGLILHSDNGSVMKSQVLLSKLFQLGILPSRSRPRVSNDNAYIESFFRTLKYCLSYQTKGFATIEIAQQWTHDFMQWFNCHHQHSGIGFVTPQQRHEGQDIEILNKRNEVYESAKLSNPSRWSGTTRDWTHIKEVQLNPDKPQIHKNIC